MFLFSSYVLGGESGLTVMEVRMQTGWAVEESLVAQLLQYPTIRVKRYEVSPKSGALTLYFSSVSLHQGLVRVMAH